MHRWFVLALLACDSESLAPEPEPEPGNPVENPQVSLHPSPEVLVVVLDTLRPDFLKSYGASSESSPNLDAFAEEAVLFEDVTAPGSWTWPVHASLFTGEPPWVHGAHRMTEGGVDLGTIRVQTLRPEVSTLAEELGGAGYATRSVSGNGLLRPELGITRGFEFAEVYDDQDDRVVARAQEWIEQDTDFPLFLFVNLLGTHLPYVQYPVPWEEEPAPLSEGWASPWVDRHLTGHEALRLNRRAPGEDSGLVLSVARGDRVLTEDELKTLRRVYTSEIWATDRRLGRLLASWEARTGGEGVVVITSDHGEHFGELGLLDHGHVLHGVNSRVPLVIQAPGIAPARVKQPVSQVAVADTVRSLVGLPSNREGLEPLLNGKKTEEKPILARSWPDPLWADVVGGNFQEGQRLVRVGDWAMVAVEDGSRSLYRISQDPLMLHDLAGTHVNVLQQLTELLPLMESRDQGKGPLPPVEPMQQALEALGYLER